MGVDLKFESASNLYSKITDGTHDSPKQQESGKHLITSKHIKGRNIDFDSAYLISEVDFNKINERSYVEQWDVIVSMIGEYCGFCYIERNEFIDYAVKNVGLYKAGTKLEAEWLYYYLTSPIGKLHLNSVKSGSSQPYLTLGGLRKLPILQPENQLSKELIVKVLADLDEKIEINSRINAELEAVAKLFYEYWFVQFDFPDANGETYKSSGGKMVYNEELKREIPVGWVVKELSEIAKIKAGGDKPKQVSEKKTLECPVPIYSNGIKEFGIYGYTNTAKIIQPSVTISARGTIGVSFLRMEPFVPIIRLIVVTPKSDDYLYYLNEQIKASNFEDSGSVQKQLTAPQVSEQKVICPDNNLLERYTVIASDCVRKIELCRNENREMTELRDWLLPMLMIGQVTVK